MKKRLSLILSIVCFTVAILAIGGMIQMANAAEPLKIIGKATIPAGVVLGGMAQVATGTFTPFQFIALEEQELYITDRFEKVLNEDGTVKIPAGYLMDGSGFKHACPAHGLETMDGGVIGVPDTQIATDKITIEMFPTE